MIEYALLPLRKISNASNCISYSNNNTNIYTNKKHLKNVGPIRHCKPPHALILHCHSPGVATIARCYCCMPPASMSTTTTTTTARDRGDRYGPIEWPNDILMIREINSRNRSYHTRRQPTENMSTTKQGAVPAQQEAADDGHRLGEW